MKKLLFCILLFFWGLSAVFAQAPTHEQLTYQTVVRNAQNQLVFNQNNVTVQVYVCNADGTVVTYSETHTGLSTNANGMLSLMIGSVAPDQGTWADIDWSTAYIKTTVSYNPGSGMVTITHAPAPVTAVPYALQAGNLDNITNILGDAIHDSIVYNINNNISEQIHDSIVYNIENTVSEQIHDSLTNALSDLEIRNCDDVNDCVATAIADGNSEINRAIDTVVLNNIGDAIADGNSDINHAIDTVVLNNIGDAIADGNSDINHAIDTVVANIVHDSLTYIINNNVSEQIHDSLTNALSDLEIRNCDDVNDCVATAIADGNSDINHAIDTVVINNIGDAIADGNSDINHAIDTVVLNNIGNAIADGNSDINHAIDTVVANIVHDSLANALNDYEIQNCDDVNDCVATAIADGNSELNRAIDTVVLNNIGDAIADGNSDINHAIDTVVLNNIGDAIADGNSDINRAIDTVVANIVHDSIVYIINNNISEQIHDSLTNALSDLEIRNCDDVNDCVATAIADGNSEINRAIDTVVINNIGDAIADGNSDINHAIDTVVANIVHDSLADALSGLEIQNCDDVNDCVAMAIADGNSEINRAIDTVVINNIGDAIADGNSDINHAIDTVVANIVHDSLANALNDYTIRNCDDVNDCVATAIADGNSEINRAIDTVVINNIGDAIADGNSDINHAIDTVVANIVHDSIVYIINNNISEQIHDSLANALNDYEIQNCDDVNNCVATAIADGNSEINRAIDTVVINNVGDAIADGNSDINHAIDTVVINNIGDAIADGNSDINHAIDTVVANIVHDSLANALNDYTIRNCDDVNDCVATAIADGNSDINRAIDTVVINNIPTNVSDFNNDANYVSTADLCTTIETTCTNVVLRNGDNDFTGANNFTGGSITVPNAITPNLSTVLASVCTQEAVNLCDLIAVFDSLNRRIQELFNEVTALKSAVPPTAYAPTVSNVTATSMNVKANATSEGLPITTYEFCISTNSDMSGSTCQTVPASDADNYTFTGLTGNTIYYVQYKATTVAGTTTSSSVQQRTPAHAPTLTVEEIFSIKPSGFSVSITNIDTKEIPSAIVRVYYKLQDGTCPNKESSEYIDYIADDVQTGIDDTLSKIHLIPATTYCIIVTVSNQDSSTLYGPYEITTGLSGTLSLTSNMVNTIDRCVDSITVTYTASVDDGEIYTYEWSDGGSSTNTKTMTYNAAGTYNVYVTATHTSPSYTLTAAITTTVIQRDTVTLGVCEVNGTVTVKSVRGNPNYINWGNNAIGNSVRVNDTNLGTYNSTGIYNIVASNEYGCSYTLPVMVVVGNNPADRTLSPCTSVSRGSVAVQSSETVNSNGDIVSVKDYDNNVYPVVEIGSQCWMAANLRATHATNGNPITSATTNQTSSSMKYYYNNLGTSISDAERGYIYNWAGAMNGSTTEGGQGICPVGWHVPTDNDWSTLAAVIDDTEGRLATGCLWNESTTANVPGNYSYSERGTIGFFAVPAGLYSRDNRSFRQYRTGAYFWSSTIANTSNGLRALYTWSIVYNAANMTQNNLGYEDSGRSVRCIRNY